MNGGGSISASLALPSFPYPFFTKSLDLLRFITNDFMAPVVEPGIHGAIAVEVLRNPFYSAPCGARAR